MTQFKKTLLATVITVTLTTTAVATFAMGNRDVDPAQRLGYIFTQLNLTETEQSEVLAVLTSVSAEQRAEMQTQRDAMRASDTRPSRDEMDALRDTRQTEQLQVITDRLNTLLAPNVTEELVTYLEAHRGSMMNGDQRRGDGQGRGQGKGQNQGDSQNQGQNRN